VLREAGGVSDAPKDPPVVTPGPLVGVDDPDDPRLDLYRDLNDPAGRIRLDADQSVFVVEGRLAVDRLLTSEYTVRSLLVDDHQATAASGVPAVSLGELKTWMSCSGHPVGVALLLGAEGPGLTNTALPASDVVAPIPMATANDVLTRHRARPGAGRTGMGPAGELRR
jgi:tRNA G18 (ribose-2'-O)-methylase SpoU